MSDVPPPVDLAPGAEQPEQQQQPEQFPPLMMPRSEFSVVQDLEFSAKLRQDTDQAFADGDHVNGYKLLGQQQEEAKRSSLEVMIEGGNPVSQTTPRSAFVHPLVETQRRAEMMDRQEKQIDVAMSQRWPLVSDYADNLMWDYFKHNEAPLQQYLESMSPEEMEMYQRQLRPVMTDPNIHADMNATIAQMDREFKMIDPKLSVYTHPKTKDIALWMLQESEPGRPGYFETAPQPFDYGAGIDIPLVPEFGERAIGFSGHLAFNTLEGGLQYPMNLMTGMTALGLDAISRITGGEPTDYWNAPTSAVDTTTQFIGMFSKSPKISGGLSEKLRAISRKQGWLHNGGKVNPQVGHMLEVRKVELDNYFERAAHEVGKIREWKKFQETGGEWLMMGMATLGGSFVGFAGTAGKAWEAGSNVAMKGMKAIGLAEKGTTLRKVQEVVTRTTGAAIAGGLTDGVAYGRSEGFSTAMVHGMQVVPLFTAIGAMGNKISRMLKKKSVPTQVATKIAAAAEGVGLGLLETNDLSPLWRFLQDGEERDWSEFAGVILKNVLVMMAMKKGSPSDMVDQLGILGEFESAIKITAREAHETKSESRREEILQAGEAEGWSREQVLDIGRQESEAATARAVDPKAAKEAREGADQAVKDATRKKEGIDEPKEVRQEKEWQAERKGRTFEHVEGKEPGPQLPEIKGVQIPARERMRLASEGKLQEPEREVVGGGSRALERAKEQGFDPLEDPKFMERFSAAERRAILERGTAKKRREQAEEYLGPEKQYKERKPEVGRRKEEGLEFLEKDLPPDKPLPKGKLRTFSRRGEERRRVEEGRREFERLEDERRVGPERRRLEPEPAKLGALKSREGLKSSQDIPLSGGKEAYKPVEGTKPLAKQDLRTLIEGRPARRGIPGAPGKLGSRKGDPIQVPLRRKGFRTEGIRATADELGVATQKAGEYDPRTETIRSTDAYDMNTLVHEWAHQLMKKTVGFDWAPSSPKAMAELMELAEPMSHPNFTQKQRIAEGWSEFFARDILGDANLQAKNPTLYKELMEWLAEKPNRAILQQYQRITDGFARWRGMGEVARAEGEMAPPTKRGKTPRKLKTKIQTEQEEGIFDTVERLAGKWVDDVHEFRRAYNKWMKLAGQDPSKISILMKPADMYAALKMTAPRVAEYMLDGAMVDINNRPIGKSMKSILKEIAPEDFRKFWVYMKRTRELEMMDRGIVVPDVDRGMAHRVRNELETPQFKEVARQMRDYFHNLIDYVMAAGGYSKEQAQHIKDAYQTYMPFQRIYDRVQDSYTGQGGDAIGRVKGGTGAPILDPMTAIRAMTTKMVAHAQQSMLLRSLHDHHLFTEGQGGFVTDVTRAVEAREIKLDAIADQIDKLIRPGDKQHELEHAADVLRSIEVDGVLNFQQATMPKKGDPIIAMRVNYTEADVARRLQMKESQLQDRNLSSKEFEKQLKDYETALRDSNGKIRWLELDADAYKMMMGVEGAVNTPALLRPFVGAARLVRAGATVLNPKFILRNTVRDVQQQGMYSKHGSPIPLTGMAAFLRGGFASPQIKELFESIGGKGTTFIGQEIMRPESSFHLEGKEMGPVALLRKGLNGLADFINAGESFIRRREFELTRKKALAEGKTEFEANLEGLLDAKEVTVNFTRNTALLRGINSVYPYFNANVQGSRKFVRHLAGYEGKAMAAQAWLHGVSHLTSMSALVQLLHGNDGWYQDLSEWQRRAYWNFKFPGDDTPYALPKPFQAGWLFTVPFEMIMDAIRGADQPLNVNDALFDFAGMFFNDFKVLPALAQPGLEVGVTEQGFDQFKGREIVPSWMVRSRYPEDRFNAYTTNTAKWLGESLGVSPLKVEHFISSTTGGMGAGLLQMIDVAAGKEPTMPRVLSYRYSSRSVTELYKALDEISQASGSKRLTNLHRRFRGRLQAADLRMDLVRDRAARGDISDTEAAKQQAAIARPVMHDYRRAQR